MNNDSITLAITTIGDLLIENKLTNVKKIGMIDNVKLKIPNYQRPYKWTTKNALQLLDDIEFALYNNKKEYRIGTLILNKKDNDYEIVDGQQRVITLSLLLHCLNHKNIPFLAENISNNAHSHKNIFYNYKALERRLSHNSKRTDDYKDDDIEKEHAKLINFIKNKCELIVVITNDLSQAFQFFDSQNARGKKLYPHDLLKAYHLREMNDLNPIETEKIVSTWERLNQKTLSELFSNYLYRLKEWIKGNKAYELNETNIDLFKGVTINDNFPFAQFYKGAYAYAENINNTNIPFVIGQQKMRTFQLNTPIIAGKPFFDYAKYYFDLLADIRDNSEFEGYFINGNNIVKTLDLSINSNGVGNKVTRQMFDSSILLYVDRFCPSIPNAQDLELLDQFVVYAFVWAYSMRAQYYNVGWRIAQNYIMGVPQKENIKNAFNIYKYIIDADTPVNLLSQLSQNIKVLNKSNIKVLNKKNINEYDSKQLEEEINRRSDQKGENNTPLHYLYYFKHYNFLEGI